MLTRIKSGPVPSPSPEDPKAPPASSMIAGAGARHKGKQLLCGRAEAHVNRVTGEIDAADKAIAQVREHLSRQMIEGDDTAAAIDELTRLENHRRALQSVLTIAKQKHEQAQADLKQAEWQLRVEVAREKLMKQLAAGKKIEERLDGLRQAVDEFNTCRQEVLSLGHSRINAQLHVADLSFKTYLFRACPTMSGCTTGYAVFQTDERWAAPWSASLPQPDQADQIGNTLPATKLILTGKSESENGCTG